MFLEKLKFAFASPALPKDVAKKEREILHSVVAQRAHGNVRLQKGRFYTKKDKDEQFERVREIQFTDS